MGYLHIDNLYKNNEILVLFRECYAMEKIHGTSAHVAYKLGELRFFAGGERYENFVALFEQGKTGPGDVATLKEKIKETGVAEVVIYGEAYGGKCQGMSDTYGKELKFVVFDVKIGDCWLAVPQAEKFATGLGLEFVSYEKIPATLEAVDREKERDSVQAVRNGMGEGRKREGVVLRPLMELTKNNESRIISKHKNDDFRETKTPRKVDPEKLKVLEEANAIAEEWVTPMRLAHVLDKIDSPDITKMKEIIGRMCEDVKREAEGEIVWSKEVQKAIGKATAVATKKFFQDKLKEV